MSLYPYGHDYQNLLPVVQPNIVWGPGTEVMPTPDTQDLYNRMMDLKNAPPTRPTTPCEGSPNDDTPSPVNVDESVSHLGAEPMSRVPSTQSHNSYDDPAVGSRRKGGARRTKPLDEPARVKAAFMRKIGCCQDCRNRKVSCDLSHHNLSCFETAYHQRQIQERQIQQQIQQRAPSPFIQPYLTPSPIPGAGMSPFASSVPPYPQPSPSPVPPSPSPGPSLSNFSPNLNPESDSRLLGIGSGALPDVLDMDPFPAGDFLHRQHQPLYPPSLIIDPSGIDHEPPFSHFFQTSPSSVIPDPSRSIEMVPQEPRPDRMVPIGKEIGVSRWQCQFGNEMNAIDSGASSVNGAVPCGWMFCRLNELEAHYQSLHLPFHPCQSPFMYECTACQTMNPKISWCLSCRQNRPSTTFYFGYVTQTVALPPNAIPIRSMGNRSQSGVFSPSSGTHTSSMPGGSAGNSFVPRYGGPGGSLGGAMHWNNGNNPDKACTIRGEDGIPSRCFNVHPMRKCLAMTSLSSRREVWKAALLLATCFGPAQMLYHIADSLLSCLIRSYAKSQIAGLDTAVSLALLGMAMGVVTTWVIRQITWHWRGVYS